MANELEITGEVKEWISKAEEDYLGAIRLSKQTKPPTYNLICFCCEQCVEKYLKAFLTAANVRFEFKHNLEKLLLPKCIKVEPSFEFIRELIRRLDAYSVEFRYPGENATRSEALSAIKAMEQVREFIREKLFLTTKKSKKRK
jgi:HEPN domain-containing protein